MKNIAFFCIPAHGHTNPMLPVARELVSRGHCVRFYSFAPFREKIERTGAQFIACDAFLPELSRAQEARLVRISTTEMTIQDIRTTRNMDDFLAQEVQTFRPHVIYTDSVCFWGKLTAWKYSIPMVVSTSTFAFNQFSSQYMKPSPREMADMVLGLPRISRELKTLVPLGYHVKSALSLVQSDNRTDSVVYTSRNFQPYGSLFSPHYAFVGPSVFSDLMPNKAKARPLLYISMGTVINDRPDFYTSCIDALREAPVDVILSCGRAMDPQALGALPDNVQVYPYVDQLEVLSRADVFITHCGMNSVSESLYMACPMILYPQTSEQHAVARRAAELGTGVYLEKDSAEGIREAVQRVLGTGTYAASAAQISRDLRSCTGAAGAADFIEGAPHDIPDSEDPLRQLNKQVGLWQLHYWAAVLALIGLLVLLTGGKYAWVLGIAAGILNKPFTDKITARLLNAICA